MNTDDAFHLSRIQAEGWNAARRLPTAHLAEISDEKVDALNPYSKKSERSRWNAGFKSAVESWQR
jgi:hypothetical protein